MGFVPNVLWLIEILKSGGRGIIMFDSNRQYLSVFPNGVKPKSYKKCIHIKYTVKH